MWVWSFKRKRIINSWSNSKRFDLATRTGINSESRMYARSLGNADDDGHMIGKQLGGSGGKKLPTARASPSCLTTSALPCRHLTITATRYGSRSLTSSAGRRRAIINPPSFRLSTRGSMRTLRRDFIIIGSATTTQGLEHTSTKTQLG